MPDTLPISISFTSSKGWHRELFFSPTTTNPLGGSAARERDGLKVVDCMQRENQELFHR